MMEKYLSQIIPGESLYIFEEHKRTTGRIGAPQLGRIIGAPQLGRPGCFRCGVGLGLLAWHRSGRTLWMAMLSRESSVLGKEITWERLVAIADSRAMADSRTIADSNTIAENNSDHTLLTLLSVVFEWVQVTRSVVPMTINICF